MSKRKVISGPNSRPALKNPWHIITSILFGLVVALTLIFMIVGISPDIASYVQGNAGISTQTNSSGQVILYPEPGRDAQLAGVENFDTLIRINGKLVSKSSDISAMLSGKVGESITVDVRKSDNRLQRYTIVLSSAYQKALEEAGLTANALAAIYVALSLLIGLGFIALGAFLLWQHPSDIVFILVAFTLALLPNSVNAVRVTVEGMSRMHLEWLYSLLRVAGLLLASSLLFIFPNGQFVPRWTRWLLIGVAVWSALYYVILIDPYILPGASIVIAGYIDYVWGVILALGVAVQIYRYQRISTEQEGQLVRRVGTTLLIAVGAFGLAWLLRNYMPPLIFNDGGWEWFNLVAELLVAAGFLYFGVSLMQATRKAG
jgi:hypothetical protein